MAVVLLGPPGAGKTTAGAAAARLVGATFVDLDAAIAAQEGGPLDAVWARGEQAFREVELQALTAALRQQDGGAVTVGGALLVAAGAGVVDTEAARDLLRRARCITLAVDVETALSRVASARPWLHQVADPRAVWLQREQARPAHRAALSFAEVDGTAPLHVVVERLCALLGARRAAGAPGGDGTGR